ncbi:MAG: hypothetical protein SGJ27_21260 [Candidatus Melainabacteria bacterium]|nr:hypothetical protein [Candidatus Melainabacteria bacterium]
MNTTFAKFLTVGPLFRDASGVVHISRTSKSDVECKLLNGNIQEFGLLSAVREVADVEMTDGFVASEAAYLSIVELLKSMAAIAGADFSGHYLEVARLVGEFASTLSVGVSA